jgi:hypothetical protein
LKLLKLNSFVKSIELADTAPQNPDDRELDPLASNATGRSRIAARAICGCSEHAAFSHAKVRETFCNASAVGYQLSAFS